MKNYLFRNKATCAAGALSLCFEKARTYRIAVERSAGN